MWKTSFIQFFKIIRQNKFFTFLNLFGVSITIMIVLIAAIKIESTIKPGGPERNNDRMLFVNNEVLSAENHMAMGGISLIKIEEYFSKMTSPKAIAFGNETPWSYFGEQGVEEFSVKNVNAEWWQVFDFEFLEGRPFGTWEVEQSSNVLVIDEKVQNRFFPDQNTLGQMLEVSGKSYKVVGVVKSVPSNCTYSFANVYMPYTLTEGDGKELMQTGSFSMIFLGASEANLVEIKDEFESIRKRIIPFLDEGYELYFGGPENAVDSYLRDWANPKHYEGSTARKLKILGRFFLVMLLPALNLISIQLIRIHERSEEIGVRKAFGATRSGLIKQILYENTLLTFIGALLGLLLALIVVYGFHDLVIKTLFNDFGEGVSLSINFILFIICLVASLALSLISGIIPAIKMSRLEPVEVLNGGKL
ncbi:MAG: FtsX-like permease family protein [Bacteroidales bacterium]|nr:FtsX-like permease family protein [Bacteroidales bacterium]MDP2235525.1 FtsX-like permease family protein [Bacteroidales bacterium]